MLVLALLGCLHRPAPALAAPAEPPPARLSHAARSHYLQARVALERGELDEAAAAYQRAILFDPGSGRLFWELAELRQQQGQYDAARELLGEALRRDEQRAREPLCLLLVEFGQVDEARQLLDGWPLEAPPASACAQAVAGQAPAHYAENPPLAGEST